MPGCPSDTPIGPRCDGRRGRLDDALAGLSAAGWPAGGWGRTAGRPPAGPGSLVRAPRRGTRYRGRWQGGEDGSSAARRLPERPAPRGRGSPRARPVSPPPSVSGALMAAAAACFRRSGVNGAPREHPPGAAIYRMAGVRHAPSHDLRVPVQHVGRLVAVRGGSRVADRWAPAPNGGDRPPVGRMVAGQPRGRSIERDLVGWAGWRWRRRPRPRGSRPECTGRAVPPASPD